MARFVLYLTVEIGVLNQRRCCIHWHQMMLTWQLRVDLLYQIDSPPTQFGPSKKNLTMIVKVQTYDLAQNAATEDGDGLGSL